jgi:putative peptidoglycan lipid II flippase
LLLERGRFDQSSTQAVAWALQFYALGLVAHSALEIVTRGFYSMHDTRTPVMIGIGAMVLNILLSVALIQPMQHGGLALANSLATIVETLLLVLVIRGRLGGFDRSIIARSGAKTALAATVMGAAVLWFTTWARTSSTVVQAGGAVIIGGFLFLAASAAVRSEELGLVLSIVRRKGTPSPRQ